MEPYYRKERERGREREGDRERERERERHTHTERGKFAPEAANIANFSRALWTKKSHWLKLLISAKEIVFFYFLGYCEAGGLTAKFFYWILSVLTYLQKKPKIKMYVF